MAKQGQDPNATALVSEAERGALDHFRQDLSDARGELAVLQREAQATVAKVRRALAPVGPLTDAARGLSTAIENLEWQLQRIAQQGGPISLGPPPARSGPGPGGVLVVLILVGLLGVGWVLWGADPDDDPPARAILRLPDDPVPPPPALPPRALPPVAPPRGG